MENLPFFEERYTPILKSEVPVYQDDLLVGFILLLAFSAFLFIQKRRYKKEVWSGLLHFFASIQSLFLLGVTCALLVHSENSLFWDNTLFYSVILLIIFALRVIGYIWIWGAFSRGGDKKKWFSEYFRYWGILGYLWFVPILILLFNRGNYLLPLLLIGISYLAFRIIIFTRSLSIFPHLRRYPLHIILYLCTCETAPVLFAYAGLKSYF